MDQQNCKVIVIGNVQGKIEVFLVAKEFIKNELPEIFYR